MVLYDIVFVKKIDIQMSIHKSKQGYTKQQIVDKINPIRAFCGHATCYTLFDINWKNSKLKYVMPYSKKAVMKIRESFGDKTIESLILDEV